MLVLYYFLNLRVFHKASTEALRCCRRALEFRSTDKALLEGEQRFYKDINQNKVQSKKIVINV